MAAKSSTNLTPKRIGPNNYLIGDGTAVLVTFSAMPDEAKNDVGKIASIVSPQGLKFEYAAWGASNNLPHFREEMVAGNNIVPALIERKRNILCGQGWYAYKERYEDDGSGMMKRIVDEVKMTEEMAAFFRKFKKESRRVVGELLKHGIAIPEFIRDKRGRILSVRSLEMKYLRAGKKNDVGEIRSWYWSNYWARETSVKQEDRVIFRLPVFDEYAKQKQVKFVLPLCDDLLSDGYYPIPAYWGGRYWIELSNIIPLFHRANLKHGSAPRFHVVIPHDYFLDYESYQQALDAEAKKKILAEAGEREAQFLKDFNDALVGVGKSGRPIVSKSEIVESMGGKYDKRIEIQKIDYEMNDEALLKLFQMSNVANVSAQALHPTLASIETAGKGIGSGTEIRTAFLLYLIIAAPVVRDMLLEIVDLVKSENSWPIDIHFAIRDAEMTTLAENPAGVRAKDPNAALTE